nr:branched-chain amino acid transporter AzlC [Lachnospiraceae bacterium]
LTDETYSLLCSDDLSDVEDTSLYRFLVSMFDQCYWVIGSVAGSILGSIIPFSTKGIEFSMTALFVASFVEQWIAMDDHIPALTGLLSTLICLIIFGPDSFLIPSMLVITLVLTIFRKRLEQGSEADI